MGNLVGAGLGLPVVGAGQEVGAGETTEVGEDVGAGVEGGGPLHRHRAPGQL